jgi:hypothetical protein
MDALRCVARGGTLLVCRSSLRCVVMGGVLAILGYGFLVGFCCGVICITSLVLRARRQDAD